jgi:hypothetical protein
MNKLTLALGATMPVTTMLMIPINIPPNVAKAYSCSSSRVLHLASAQVKAVALPVQAVRPARGLLPHRLYDRHQMLHLIHKVIEPVQPAHLVQEALSQAILAAQPISTFHFRLANRNQVVAFKISQIQEKPVLR